MSISADSIMFDVWSASYDRPGLQQTTYRPIHDAILDRLDGCEFDGALIVDLGCGTGQMTLRLADAFPAARVVGVDLSPGMIERAVKNHRAATDDHDPGANFAIADAVDLPLPANSADLVVCTESFHWYEDQATTLDGLFRLLRPGGRLIIASIATITGIGDDALREATALAGRPIRAIPKRRMRRLMTDAGFEVTHQGRIVRLGFLPWPLLTEATRP